MSENMMVPADFAADLAQTDDDMFEKIAASGSYLPRINLTAGQSALVTEGKAGVGVYVLVRSKEDFVILDRSFDCLVLAYRFKALKIANGEIINCYDPNSKMWDEIAALSDVKDSGCSYGPEFLLWVPNLGYATFFCNSKTSRKEAKNIKAIQGMLAQKKLPAMTLQASIKKNEKYKWWGPDALVCSTPLAAEINWSEAKEQAERFKNPPKSESDKVVAADASGGAEDRD